jgi:DNA-binding PucR family transcriptional regulator
MKASKPIRPRQRSAARAPADDLASSADRAQRPARDTDVRRLADLAEIARLINSSGDLRAVLNRIVSAVCQHSSWASCGIMGVNRKAGLSELIVRFDPRLDPANNPPTSWKLEESATMRVIETNKPVIIADAQRCDEFLAYRVDSRLRGYHTVVVLPLGTTDPVGREMTIAMHSRDIVQVSDTELAFLSTVTQLASIAVEKAKRLQIEQDRALRLHRTVEISTELMESVLTEHSMDAVVSMVAAVLPHPLIIADLAAGTFNVRRSPAPKVLSDGEWKRMVSDKLAPTIVDMVRSAGAAGERTGRALIVNIGGLPKLHPLIEPLQVNGETVGGLIIFPPAEGVDDLDEVLIHAARLALDVQMMRDYVRFRSEADSVAEVFRALFADLPRHPGEFIARAKRLGLSLPGPARLVTIGFPSEVLDSGEPRTSALQLNLARTAADLIPGAAVILDNDFVIFAPVNGKEGATAWKRFLRGIAAAVENYARVKPIIAESRLCRRLQDYRDARLECGRVITLARMFGKTGPVSQGDFGPFALLLSTVDHPSARTFVRDTLGAIEEYDRGHGTELLRTLEEFLRNGSRYQACADRMGIHVSTLRYRLDRLHELFGTDLAEPDSVFGLTLALRLRELEAGGPLGTD